MIIWDKTDKDELSPKDCVNQVICGDCLEVLKFFPDDFFDLVVTSPPYNQRLTSMAHAGGKFKAAHWFKNLEKAYADELPESVYQKQQRVLLQLLYYKIKYSGSVFYNHKIRYRDKEPIDPKEWILNNYLLLREEVIWNRGGGFTLNARMFPLADERIYWFVKDRTSFKFNNIGKKWPSVWTISPKKKQTVHVTAFPSEIPNRCIQACSSEDDLVLDPYAGQGTTAVESKRLGRKFMAIELNKHWCECIEMFLAQTAFGSQKHEPHEKEVKKSQTGLDF